MAQVVVAHAAGDAGIGATVAKALEDAGLEVARAAGTPGRTRRAVDGALVLVWSRNAAADAGLRRTAAAAAARGRLALARVDAAAAPPSLRTHLNVAIARADPARGLRPLVEALLHAPPPPPKRMIRMSADDADTGSTWKGVLVMTALLAATAWGAAWLTLGASPAPLLLALLHG